MKLDKLYIKIINQKIRLRLQGTLNYWRRIIRTQKKETTENY